MKDARVNPLFKKNSPLEVSNYRPVSILSIVSKVLERSVYNQLYTFFSHMDFYMNYSQVLGVSTTLIVVLFIY